LDADFLFISLKFCLVLFYWESVAQLLGARMLSQNQLYSAVSCPMFSFTSGSSTLHWWFWIMNVIKL